MHDMASSNSALADRFTDGCYEQGLPEVLRGLLYIPRQLSHVWLYDERGCRLFEKICQLPEYYLTHVETAIMRTRAATMAEAIGAEVAVIEFGSGDGAKTRLLLAALAQPRYYVPVDIAASSLARTARALQRDYPQLKVLPLCADFTRRIELPPLPAAERRLIYFPGSTLGNYSAADAVRLLRLMRELAGSDGLALIGFDLVKDRSLLERAYNDEAGVTAEFNLNALRHVNRRLGIGFDVSHFRHRALWVESEQRIEMHLIGAVNQTVRVGAAAIRMLRGDFIRTEYCHKYTVEGFASLAAQAGWTLRDGWSDENQWFRVQLLAAR
jgi:L-histidine Nalpha-methyltransferase